MSNLIECATCGYPLTPEERTTLVEVNGKMRKPWLGLTYEEQEEIVANSHSIRDCVTKTTVKLKEKNT